jgi:hypothetical protein
MTYNPAVVKNESELAILALGGRVCSSLPVIELAELRPRGPREVADRALVLAALVQMSFGTPRKLVKSWLHANSLAGCLSAGERAVVDDSEGPAASTRSRLRWNMEGLWAAVWAGGLVDDLSPATPIGDELATLVPDLRTQESPGRFLDSFSLRPTNVLLATLDLLYRAHWAARDARQSGAEDCPFNEGVVHERRKFLEWSLNADVDWDDVDMST